MLLENKVAVIYGAGGVGGAVARAFAREGATVFLASRNLSKAEAVAKEIKAKGGTAETAKVDALDEKAVEKHLQSVIDKAGRIDISLNAVGIPNTKLQGIPFVDLPVEQFAQPIETYPKSFFITSRQAARRMAPNKSGVIMTVTPVVARIGMPLIGGFAPAMSALESLTRGLSAELAPQGIRVVCLRAQGMPDSDTFKEVLGIHGKAYGITAKQFEELIAQRTHAHRLTTLAETANAAAFAASDQASGLTGTVVNLSLGMLDD